MVVHIFHFLVLVHRVLASPRPVAIGLNTNELQVSFQPLGHRGKSRAAEPTESYTRKREKARKREVLCG
jgi:hypothetical protein